ncbi:elongation factor G [Kaustia mangrovi]|uniref:Elongation factor G n=1 Tax=Kaustia mangrovi TaxID=2593653 RepID=A0A7S8HCK8_9HYPH|nr:elongation factor G [Kaustia mangrovi]QPC43726.1 elongation factor G [Kaustia mangrovi]
MAQTTGRPAAGPRCIALVGPYLCGKTTLLDAILYRTGAIGRQGRVADGSTVGDASPEARSHGMSVEVNAASTDFLGDSYTFLDCPGSIEFAQEQAAVLAGCDAAVVVCEPDDKKVPAIQLILKQLDALGVPRLVFINKVDKASGRIRDVLEYLQPASDAPLVLRQIPIWESGIVTGFVDLALERAFLYREHAPSEVIELPGDLSERKEEARFSMLEKLADYDDALMEQLLEDIEPPRDAVFDDLSAELAEGQITPVLLGSAENGNGIVRLMKALRHEVCGVEGAAERLGLDGGAGGGSVAQVLKTIHTPHSGKLSLVRVLKGEIADGATLYGRAGKDGRVGGLFTLMGQETRKRDKALAGDTVALGRLEDVATGDTLTDTKGAAPQLHPVVPMAPVYGLALDVNDRKDEVKLTTALARIVEEDPSLVVEQNTDTQELVLWGQGEMHLRVALERLAEKYGVSAQSHPRRIAYKETIRKSVTERGRHKKQTGGHGQFGDVVLEIRPLPRGEGFAFSDTISGGVVPKQYIPAVEAGVREYMQRGPLGFPVVDIAVTLTDGSYHTVDSSEQAFKAAARLAMSEGMAKCSPVLLEPVVAVEIHVPQEATSKVNQIVSGRRGQILGFDAREGWSGWDTVRANMSEGEIQNLIVEIRSATAGVGTFTFAHDHMAELTGKMAEEVLAAKAA